jgi:nucleoside-diphosphate-sugar epimerase
MTSRSNVDHSSPTVALTGGSGFLGHHILKKLLTHGFHVQALQNKTLLSPHNNLTPVSGSLNDQDALRQLVHGAHIVIHCGGTVAQKKDQGFFKINKAGTENLITACQQSDVQKFLYISSLSAREAHLSPYATSKLNGENALQQSQITSWDIIRPPGIYGPGDKQMLPLIKLLKKNIAFLLAKPNARVSMIYCDDLAEAILQWALSDKAYQTIYEIGDPQKNGHSWVDLLTVISNTIHTDNPKKPYYIPIPPQLSLFIATITQFLVRLSGRTPFLTPNKIRELMHPDWTCHDRQIEKNIDWTPKTDFKEGMEKTIAWYKQQKWL